MVEGISFDGRVAEVEENRTETRFTVRTSCRGPRRLYSLHTCIHTYIHTYKRASIPLHQNHTTPHYRTAPHTLLFSGTVTAAAAVVVEGSRARPRHWRVIIPFNSSRLIARIVCACSTEGERGERWKKSKERQGGSVGWGIWHRGPSLSVSGPWRQSEKRVAAAYPG